MTNEQPKPLMPARRSGNGSIILIALVLILLLGAMLRFIGINWDQFQHLHPDERFLTMVETSITLPNSLGEYFNSATSPLNPYNRGYGTFVYGTFPLFFVKVIGELAKQNGYDQIHLVGRALSTLADLSTVLLIFLIGQKLYDKRVGLLAALFLALSVLDIQQSHFFTVDAFTNLFVVLAFFFAVDVAERHHGWLLFVLLGISFGLALASKIGIYTFALVVALAGLQRLNHSSRRFQTCGYKEVIERNIAGLSLRVSMKSESARQYRYAIEGAKIALGLVVAALVAFLVFRIAQPYAFSGPSFFDVWPDQRFVKDMGYISKLVNGLVDYPPSHQWTNRTPYVFPWTNIVLWGLGLPLGLAAWVGWGLALARLIWRREGKHLLPVAWVGITFLYQGGQFVKSMRYFLPIYPFLALLAAYGLIFLWDYVQGRRAIQPRLVRPAVAAIIALVVLGTLFWAVAFASIYTRPVSRVTASLWIYDHIPPGSVLANEHWDDPLPLRIGGRDPFGGMYRGLSSSSDGLLHLYDEDTPEKREQLIAWLTEADYIILSSNRLYESIPRLPMRYPMTTEYYQLLFNGGLGFKLVGTFTSYPQLFGIEINDDGAEEVFSVYDHPKVLIFQRSADFSAQRVREIFECISLDNVVRLTPLQAASWKGDLTFDSQDRAVQEAGGTWSEMFDRGSIFNRLPFFFWWLAVEIIGLAAFPLVFLVFRNFVDRGYVVSKALGLLVLAWLVWLAASFRLLPYTWLTIALCLLMLAVVGAILAAWQRRALLQFWRERRAIVLIAEGLFLLFLVAFYAIRLGNPDLWHPVMGGEKPMDFAYLNAVMKSTFFPPYDPWFAGGYVNYYYFGFVIVGTLIKLTGIVPAVAYNLTIPLLFALTAMGAFAVVFNLVAGDKPAPTGAPRPSMGAGSSGRASNRTAFLCGLAGALFVAVIGNLDELFLLMRWIRDLGHVELQSTIPGLVGLIQLLVGVARWLLGGQLPVRIEWWYWNATRVIPHLPDEAGPINEFPFFTFLYADLHAHMIAMPLTLLALALAVNIVKGWMGKRKEQERATISLTSIFSITFAEVVGLAMLGFVLGALRVTNTWDWPTYLLIALAALVIAEYARRQRIDWNGLGAVAWQFAVLFVLSTLFFWPFYQHYAMPYTEIELWKGSHTTADAYLAIHGFYLFIVVTFLIGLAFARPTRSPLVRLTRLMAERWSHLPRLLDLYHVLVGTPKPVDDACIAPTLLPWLIVFAIAAYALLGFALWGLGYEVLALLLPLGVLAGFLVLRPRTDDAPAPTGAPLLSTSAGTSEPEDRFIVLLIGGALALGMAVEVVVLKGDISRMNTVFKFYLQGWNFFAISSAFALAFIARRLRPEFRMLWWSAFTAMLLACFLYPVLATNAKVHDRFDASLGPGGDGMAYMTRAVYSDQNQQLQLVWDYQAINWMLDNIKGSPTIAEANTPLYRWGSRVSIYTGLPTVIGWDWHQKQQRAAVDGQQVDRRIADLRDFFNTPDPAQAIAFLRKYGVSYVYMGDLERAYYDAAGLAKFDQMAGQGQLNVVYDNGHVKIYRVTSNK